MMIAVAAALFAIAAQAAANAATLATHSGA
jgi:hypothetical protein